MWRPEGWEKVIEKLEEDYFEGTGGNNAENSGFSMGLQAGADAMLTHLLSQEHEDWLATAEGQEAKGQWVYIPEEKEE